MPELPEVETVVRGLNQRVSGEVIESIWLGPRRQPLKSGPQEIAQAVEGKRITQVRRVGKHIVIDLQDKTASKRRAKGGSQRQWIVHLGMTGRLLVCEAKDDVAKHTHAIAKLRSGRELRFVDPRMFGKLSVTNEPFAGPGKEPLTISEEEFIALFRRRKTAIKAALLNQKLLHGVGNIYADESLFRAGIRPRRRAGKLTRAELLRLRESLVKVLEEAIRAGGSSVSDYVNADGEEGLFQLEHNVYLRTGEPCLVCKTPIRRITLAGRGTHYCPRCQK